MKFLPLLWANLRRHKARTLFTFLSIVVAFASPGVREVMRTRATDAIAASASPRNPSVWTRSSSSSEAILLVAWRASASASWLRSMPQPSSLIATRRTPPSSMRNSMRRAPESIAFSSSSLTTDAGRSTTSPAAIWLISVSSSGRIERRWGGGGEFIGAGVTSVGPRLYRPVMIRPGSLAPGRRWTSRN